MEKSEIIKKAESLLPTLTTTYYTKGFNGLTIKQTCYGTSYFCPSSSEIFVSLENVATIIAASSLQDEKSIERAVRGQLYHELSHAILTPTSYGSFPVGLTFDDFNLIEDERIETIFAKYYLGVDFKEQIKTLCPYPTEGVTTWDAFFFFAVRHRRAPYKQAEINELVNNFIVDNKKINSTADYPTAQTFLEKVLDLKNAIYAIWLEYQAKNPSTTPPSKGKSEQGKGQPQSGGQSQSGQGGEANGEDGEEQDGKAEKDETKGGKSKNITKGDEDDKSENGESGEASETDDEDDEDGEAESKDGGNITSGDENNGETDNRPISIKDAESLMDAAVIGLGKSAEVNDELRLSGKKVDKTAFVEMLKIISKKTGFGQQKHSVLYGYSGKISSRRIANDYNDSYKWFAKSTSIQGMTANKSDKKVLNLWLDQSGSFRKHDRTINTILAGLNRLEKERDDFEWNLIRVDSNFVVETNKERRGSCSLGGNSLPKAEIEDCYRKTNKTGKEVNIVIFDGRVGYLNGDDALAQYAETYGSLPYPTYANQIKENANKLCDSLPNYRYDNLAILNNKRTIFIVEGENVIPLQRVCPKAREIIKENRNYEGKLKENIVKALGMLF